MDKEGATARNDAGTVFGAASPQPERPRWSAALPGALCFLQAPDRPISMGYAAWSTALTKNLTFYCVMMLL